MDRRNRPVEGDHRHQPPREVEHDERYDRVEPSSELPESEGERPGENGAGLDGFK